MHSVFDSIPDTWTLVSLGNLGTFSKGSGIKKTDLLEEGLPCLRYGEIYTVHDIYIKQFHSFINRETANKSKRIYAGDLLFAGSGETLEDIGKCVAYTGDEEAYAGGDIIILRLSKGDAKYLGFLLNHDVVNRQKYRLGQGHSVVHIYSRHLKSVLIPFPPLEEQRKIAEILSAWDEAITLTERLIEGKQKRKKGLMQQLLTGKVRFPGFEGSDEWLETKIGRFPADWDLVTLASLGSFSKGSGIKKSELVENGLPCVRYGEIYTIHHFQIKEFRSFIRSETASKSKKIW